MDAKEINNRKRRKAKRLLFNILFSFVLIVALGILLAYNIGKRKDDGQKKEKYALIDKKSVTLVYGDKLAVEVPENIGLNKEMTIKKLINSENYKLLLRTINEIFPEKVESYRVIKYTKPELNVKNIRRVPTHIIEDKEYILTTETQELFDNLYAEKSKNETNIVVDILNANGIVGYAREAGERLKSKLNVSYTAANYEKNTNYSLIRINEIDKEKLEEILVTLSENYFKVKKEEEIPTLANLVIILGKEQLVPLKIDVIGGNKIAKDLYADLKRAGYKNLILRDTSKKVERNVVEYNSEDYYTALKISKKFNIRAMQENKNLKNKINIYVK